MDAALRTDLPVLAVCRGIQILNVALGGDLVQQLPDLVGSNATSLARERLGSVEVVTEPRSAVRRLFGERAEVLCSHHQAIGRLGRDLVVTARSGDGVIEAVELPGQRFVVGVQWHPEETGDRRLFDALVEPHATVRNRIDSGARRLVRGWNTAMSGSTTVVNPATEAPIVEVPLAGVEETDAGGGPIARGRARRGGQWPRRTGPD